MNGKRTAAWVIGVLTALCGACGPTDNAQTPRPNPGVSRPAVYSIRYQDGSPCEFTAQRDGRLILDVQGRTFTTSVKTNGEKQWFESAFGLASTAEFLSAEQEYDASTLKGFAVKHHYRTTIAVDDKDGNSIHRTTWADWRDPRIPREVFELGEALRQLRDTAFAKSVPRAPMLE